MESQRKRNSIDWVRSLDSSGSSQAQTQVHVSQPAIETSSVCGSVKKRRKKRRKSTHKIDSLKREDNGDTSEDEDMFPIEISSDEENDLLDNSRYPPLIADLMPNCRAWCFCCEFQRGLSFIFLVKVFF